VFSLSFALLGALPSNSLADTVCTNSAVSLYELSTGGTSTVFIDKKAAHEARSAFWVPAVKCEPGTSAANLPTSAVTLSYLTSQVGDATDIHRAGLAGPDTTTSDIVTGGSPASGSTNTGGTTPPNSSVNNGRNGAF
jgi:hypothetical protein